MSNSEGYKGGLLIRNRIQWPSGSGVRIRILGFRRFYQVVSRKINSLDPKPKLRIIAGSGLTRMDLITLGLEKSILYCIFICVRMEAETWICSIFKDPTPVCNIVSDPHSSRPGPDPTKSLDPGLELEKLESGSVSGSNLKKKNQFF